MFFARTYALGEEQYVTDGSAGGTTLLADVNPGTAIGVGQFFDGEPMTVGNRVFFDGTTGANDILWTTDGTPAGTKPTSIPYPTYDNTALGNVLLFDNSTVSGTGVRTSFLDATDGTLAGARTLAARPSHRPGGERAHAVGLA